MAAMGTAMGTLMMKKALMLRSKDTTMNTLANRSPRGRVQLYVSIREPSIICTSY